MTTEEYFAMEQGKQDGEKYNLELEINWLKNKCTQYSNEKEEVIEYADELQSQIEQLQQHLMDCKEEYLELEAKYLVQLELNQALKTALAYSEDAAKKGDNARLAAGGMEIEIQQLRHELERMGDLNKAVQKLLIAGGATSNCCYNVGQQGGRVLNQRDANSLYQSAEDWDKTVNEVRKLK